MYLHCLEPQLVLRVQSPAIKGGCDLFVVPSIDDAKDHSDMPLGCGYERRPAVCEHTAISQRSSIHHKQLEDCVCTDGPIKRWIGGLLTPSKSEQRRLHAKGDLLRGKVEPARIHRAPSPGFKRCGDVAAHQPLDCTAP